MRNQVENCYPYVVLYSQWFNFFSEVSMYAYFWEFFIQDKWMLRKYFVKTQVHKNWNFTPEWI